MPRLVRTHLYNEKYPVMKIKHNSIATYEIRTYKRNADPLERWPKQCRNSYVYQRQQPFLECVNYMYMYS